MVPLKFTQDRPLLLWLFSNRKLSVARLCKNMAQNLLPNTFQGKHMLQTFGTITNFLVMVTNFGIPHQRLKLLIKLQILFIKTGTILFTVV